MTQIYYTLFSVLIILQDLKNKFNSNGVSGVSVVMMIGVVVVEMAIIRKY